MGHPNILDNQSSASSHHNWINYCFQRLYKPYRSRILLNISDCSFSDASQTTYHTRTGNEIWPIQTRQSRHSTYIIFDGIQLHRLVLFFLAAHRISDGANVQLVDGRIFWYTFHRAWLVVDKGEKVLFRTKTRVVGKIYYLRAPFDRESCG